jgi:hypothetical protein
MFAGVRVTGLRLSTGQTYRSIECDYQGDYNIISYIDYIIYSCIR